MNVPEDLRYTKDHEWVAFNQAENIVRVGITNYAQYALGDIVFVQVPTTGTKVQAGITICEVESTKSVSDIYSPVTGEIVEVNESLSDAPQTVNEDPYGQGWICAIRPDSFDEDLFLDAASYSELVRE